MRSHLAIAMLGAWSLSAAILCSSAALADPYFHRETNGSWTDSEYNDGVCHYQYSHNAWDQETHVNRWGDCSHVAIGAGGEPLPMVPAPIVIPSS